MCETCLYSLKIIFLKQQVKHFVDFHIFEWKHKYKKLKRNSIFCYNDIKQAENSMVKLFFSNLDIRKVY